MRRARVLLADDHSLVAAGLHKLLEPRFEVVGIVADGEALVEAARDLKPDVILLDIAMPVLNGIEAARVIKKSMPGARLVFVTMHADADYVAEALRAGAAGYVLKRSAASELVAAIEEVLGGRVYITPLAQRQAEGKARTELTARQRQVLQLIAEGRPSKQIAAILGISPKTVEFHRSCISQKLGLRTTADLTKYALLRGIIAG